MRFALSGLIVAALAAPLHAETTPLIPPVARTVDLSGPRFGITTLDDGVVAKLKERSILATSIWTSTSSLLMAQESERGLEQQTTPVVSPPMCVAMSPVSPVVMTLNDGSRLRGTLLCLSESGVAFAAEGQVMRRPLAEISRIEKPRDGVDDGFLKGAAIGLIVWGVMCTHCPAEYMLRATMGYAFMGLALDALHGGGTTLYRGAPPSASMSFRVRF